MGNGGQWLFVDSQSPKEEWPEDLESFRPFIFAVVNLRKSEIEVIS
jgi:hypothetical protein